MLRCRLQEMDIANAEGYDALSYAWGDQVADRYLLCDGDVLAITQSLELALKALRPSQGAKLIWADGVCINQGDINERGHQVQQMRYIYSRATSVMVYLGADKKGYAHEAFKICKEIYQANEAQILSGQNHMHPPASSRYWIPLAELFTCSWFARLWVIQELTSSRTASVIWGQESIAWKALFISASWLGTFRSTLVRRAPYLGVPLVMEGIRYYHNEGTGTTFSSLVQDTWYFQCTDDRDRIYAILGLPCKDSQIVNAIYPDYNITKSQLYQKVARLILLHDKSVDYLVNVYHGPTLEDWSATVLPSWCPQHRLPNPAYFSCSDRRFAASRGLSSSRLLHHNRLSTLYPDSLWLQGFKYDTIRFKARRSASYYMSDEVVLHLILEWWTELVKEQITNKANLNHDDLPLRSRENGTDLNLLFVDSLAGGISESQKKSRRAPLQTTLSHVIRLCRMQDVAKRTQDMANMLGSLERSLSCLITITQSARSFHATKIFADIFRHACGLRNAFITSRGYFGVGPAVLKEGDQVCILLEGSVPFILRKEEPIFRLIGEAYISQLMDGEAVTEWRNNKSALETFEIR
jgi:hypothetical protein